MATFHLADGERIYVDDDVLALIEGQTWSRDAKGTVARSYREGGQVKRQSLHSLLERHLGFRRARGEVLVHLDDNWRNFRAENLQVVPRGSWLYRVEPDVRKERASKAGKIGGAKGGRGRRTNSTGFVGVHPAGKKFKAMATVNGKQTYLKLHDTPEAAARAYDQALIDQGLPPVNFPAR